MIWSHSSQATIRQTIEWLDATTRAGPWADESQTDEMVQVHPKPDKQESDAMIPFDPDHEQTSLVFTIWSNSNQRPRADYSQTANIIPNSSLDDDQTSDNVTRWSHSRQTICKRVKDWSGDANRVRRQTVWSYDVNRAIPEGEKSQTADMMTDKEQASHSISKWSRASWAKRRQATAEWNDLIDPNDSPTSQRVSRRSH